MWHDGLYTCPILGHRPGWCPGLHVGHREAMSVCSPRPAPLCALGAAPAPGVAFSCPQVRHFFLGFPAPGAIRPAFWSCSSFAWIRTQVAFLCLSQVEGACIHFLQVCVTGCGEHSLLLMGCSLPPTEQCWTWGAALMGTFWTSSRHLRLRDAALCLSSKLLLVFHEPLNCLGSHVGGGSTPSCTSLCAFSLLRKSQYSLTFFGFSYWSWKPQNFSTCGRSTVHLQAMHSRICCCSLEYLLPNLVSSTCIGGHSSTLVTLLVVSLWVGCVDHGELNFASFLFLLSF